MGDRRNKKKKRGFGKKKKRVSQWGGAELAGLCSPPSMGPGGPCPHPKFLGPPLTSVFPRHLLRCPAGWGGDRAISPQLSSLRPVPAMALISTTPSPAPPVGGKGPRGSPRPGGTGMGTPWGCWGCTHSRGGVPSCPQIPQFCPQIPQFCPPLTHTQGLLTQKWPSWGGIRAGGFRRAPN